MTTLVAMIGLFPAAVSNGIGAQTQKPLAIVVIGGAMMLAVVARFLQPPLLVVAHQWLETHRQGGGGPQPGAMPDAYVEV
jgi:cobalt-zinc-cadmium resistance protein CzcA